MVPLYRLCNTGDDPLQRLLPGGINGLMSVLELRLLLQTALGETSQLLPRMPASTVCSGGSVSSVLNMQALMRQGAAVVPVLVSQVLASS